MTNTARKLPPQTPRPPRSLLAELAEADRAHASRAIFQDFLTHEERGFAEYRDIVRTVVSDLIGLLQSGVDIEVERTIETLHGSELSDQRLMQEIERDGAAILRQLAKEKRPEGIVVINEAMRAFNDRLARMARLHRDARWDLMKARAMYAPSQGRGPIRGAHTDADDYLKTIG